MDAKLIGGPYHGTHLDSDTVNRCTSLVPINDATPPRLFILMPPKEDWDRIVAGEITKDETSGGHAHPYERVFVDGGVEFHDAAENGAFDAALRGEHPDPHDTFGSHENLLAYKLECNLAQFLADAATSVVPLETLGGGMSLSSTTDTSRDYNDESDEITITGIVKITVSKTKSEIDT